MTGPLASNPRIFERREALPVRFVELCFEAPWFVVVEGVRGGASRTTKAHCEGASALESALAQRLVRLVREGYVEVEVASAAPEPAAGPSGAAPPAGPQAALLALAGRLGVAAARAAEDSGDLEPYREHPDRDVEALMRSYWEGRYAAIAEAALEVLPEQAQLPERAALADQIYAAYARGFRAT